MPLKDTFGRNVIANVASQAFMAVIGIAMVPTLVRMLGAEAYGLVGFFVLLQAWFQLLDMGLTPTLLRATAQFQGGGMSARELTSLVGVLEVVFLGVALIGAGSLFALSGWLSEAWFKVEHLDPGTVQSCLRWMAVAVGCRWMTGIYKGALSGFEAFGTLSLLNAASATLRFAGVIPVMAFLGADPILFFKYQAAIGAFELATLYLLHKRRMPHVETPEGLSKGCVTAAGMLRFSMGIAFTGAVWVAVTQVDKLVLSRVLDLKTFGYFSVANTVAGGLAILSGPVITALMPRMTCLVTEGDVAGAKQVYLKSSGVISLLVFPAAWVLVFFAPDVLYVWTGSQDIAHHAAPALRLYALGNALLALVSMQYCLQFAYGDLKLHVIAALVLLLGSLPLSLLGAVLYGIPGAGSIWVFANLFFLLVWTFRVHQRFWPGFHRLWAGWTTLLIVVPGVVVALGWALLQGTTSSRTGLLMVIGGVGVVAFLFAIVFWFGVRSKLWVPRSHA